MKKIVLSVALAATCVMAKNTVVQAASAQAPAVNGTETSIKETGWYVGLGIDAMSSRDSRVSMDIFNEKQGQDRLGNLDFIGGYIVNDWVAVEGRFATGLTDEDRVELSSRWSIFVKPFYKFEDDEDRAAGEDYWSIYGLLGYGNTNIEGTNGTHADVDDSDFQWGIGVSYTFREAYNEDGYRYRDVWTIFADYTSVGRDLGDYYYNGAKNVDVDTFTVGLIYKF
jgi:hypothetical protein